MASKEPALEVVIDPAASLHLIEIWDWNASEYGVSHANDYLQFLRAAIQELASPGLKDRDVPALPHLRFRVVRKRNRGYGHVLVYRVSPERINLLHVFHTAQDWKTAILSSEEAP